MDGIKLFGISIQPHWTFLMFLLLILITGGTNSLLLLLLIFTSIVFHEIAHSMVARHFGVEVKKIILLPIGGMAIIEEQLKEPKQELLTALAGPLFNFVVVFICEYAFTFITPQNFLYETLQIIRDTNLILGSFNLFVPAIPMDGGRILRSLLAMKFSFLKATQYAAQVSRFIAIFAFFLAFLLTLVGEFTFSVWLSILALFVYFGANTEYESTLLSSTLARLSVADALNPYLPMLSPTDTAEDAFKFMFANRFPAVIVSGKKNLILEYSDFDAIKGKDWSKVKLSSLAKPCKAVRLNTPLLEVIKIMDGSGRSVLPVQSNKSIIGLVSKDNIALLFSLLKRERGV